jgi:hypothetical protein
LSFDTPVCHSIPLFVILSEAKNLAYVGIAAPSKLVPQCPVKTEEGEICIKAKKGHCCMLFPEWPWF